MAKNSSRVTRKFSGKFGDEIVFRRWKGKSIAAAAPEESDKPATVKQLEVQKKFLLASRYAKAVMSAPDQSMKQAYARVLGKRQNVYCRATEDYLKPPKVEIINTGNYHGAINDKIIITAVDDFRVIDVQVEIYAPNGTLLERESADINLVDDTWTYIVQQANNLLAGTKIKAIATDVPGNKGILEVTL